MACVSAIDGMELHGNRHWNSGCHAITIILICFRLRSVFGWLSELAAGNMANAIFFILYLPMMLLSNKPPNLLFIRKRTRRWWHVLGALAYHVMDQLLPECKKKREQTHNSNVCRFAVVAAAAAITQRWRIKFKVHQIFCFSLDAYSFSIVCSLHAPPSTGLMWVGYKLHRHRHET